ncbi:MAG: 3'(2'),5'-bisphosphate nucleotidase [Flavobacteriales bacterium TMED288]|mgnify:CR=1 FL=1|nr:3'(2'),5'-bisphosphate nucleotidase [Flavobacteriales bacterium]RPG52977.1 MAG: 3'(2'),5'-bisphosphate nucleotidase [Flavobacteriales bacterium TMED288]|tara:strand:+ start:10666 stop:11496 length:831 start_codon:yes stop_codon:yes gene_type:complete
MKEELNIAIRSAINAGFEILKIYNSNNFNVKYKKDRSPVTLADELSNKIICKYLIKTGIPILSEENDQVSYDFRKKWEKLWLIDPLDGTKEFIKKNGEFAVNIALIVNKTPKLGVIFIPVTSELYFSSPEYGSLKSHIKSKNSSLSSILKKSIKLPIEKNPSETFKITVSRSHKSVFFEKFLLQSKKKYSKVSILNKGSSIKLCIVAEGKADCYPRFSPSMEWDTAAGQAICFNAGYDLIDLVTKKNMVYNRINLTNNFFLVKKNNLRLINSKPIK